MRSHSEAQNVAWMKKPQESNNTGKGMVYAALEAIPEVDARSQLCAMIRHATLLMHGIFI
jgi:hypothetical protein